MKTNKAESSMFPPIKITLDGKEILIPKVPYRILKKLTSDEAEKLEADEQLALLTGRSVKELEEADAREIAKALRDVMKELMSPFNPKTETSSIEEKAEKNGLKPSEES